MGWVVNKTTLKLITSAHLHLYDEAEWLIKPDLSAVEGVPQKHWKLVDDEILPMTPAEIEDLEVPCDHQGCDCNAVNDALGGPAITGIPYV